MNIAFVCTNIQPFILERIHQLVSPISNFESTILYNEYLLWLLFQLANWEKKPVLEQLEVFFIFNCSNWERFVEKLVKISDESNLGIPCKFRLYFLFAFATIALFLESLFFYWNPTRKVGVFLWIWQNHMLKACYWRIPRFTKPSKSHTVILCFSNLKE